MYVADQTNALLSKNACVKFGLISYHVTGVNTVVVLVMGLNK